MTLQMRSETKILMLEDVPEEAEMLQRELHKAGQIGRASCRERV